MLEMANIDPEGIDGVWMSYNVWPRMKVEASKCVILLAASISPICPHPDIPTPIATHLINHHTTEPPNNAGPMTMLEKRTTMMWFCL